VLRCHGRVPDDIVLEAKAAPRAATPAPSAAAAQPQVAVSADTSGPSAAIASANRVVVEMLERTLQRIATCALTFEVR